MSKDMSRGDRRLTIWTWVAITLVIVGTVLTHIDHLGPKPSDLLSLGIILQSVSVLVRPRRPKLAGILTAATGAAAILFWILFFMQARQ